ncbi:MAG: hypothetical protein VXW65_09655, partial [Pseudomonadota bacterium]|nr:hypothetical protein [Pseudomonadota bacterium]
SWVALVKNKNKVEVSFVAIDKCVLSDADATGIGRCDAMLYTSNRLYLVELKKVRSGWKGDAIQQLIDTIDSIFHFHAEQLQSFQKRKAFVCNKRHPHFTQVDNELQARIYREYKFRIDVQAEVIILD